MSISINSSFSGRFSFYVILIVGLFNIFIFTVLLNLIEKSIYNQTKDKVDKLLQISNLEIEKIFLQAEIIPQNSKRVIFSDHFTIDSYYELTRQIVTDNDFVFGSAIALEPYYYEREGLYFSPYSCRMGEDSIATFQLGNKDYDYFSMDWYLIPKLLKTPYWSEPYFDQGTIMSTYSLPLFDQDSNFIGVFTIDLSLNWLSKLVNELRPFEHSYTFVIGRGGTYILHDKKERLLNESIFTMAIEKNNDAIREVGQNMVDGKQGSQLLTIDSVSSYVFYAPIPRIGWSIGMVCPYDEVFRDKDRLRSGLILVSIIGLFIMFSLTYLIIKRLAKPLHQFALSAKEIAAGNLNAKLPDIKSNDEMKKLQIAFENMQHDLSNYIETLKSTTSAKEKIESELRIARDIQMGMLPKIFPPFPERNDIDLYAILIPAREVGGDLYDFFIDNEQLYFAIGDVSGKGVPASLLMAVTRSLFRSFATHFNNPSKICESLNNVISESNESNMFVTFFVGILDLKTGYLHYANAGHNAPYIIDNKGNANQIPAFSNLPLGILQDFTFESQELTLDHNATIFLYTDGLTEAEDANAVLYGDDRLTKFLNNVQFTSTKSLIEKTRIDVESHVKEADQSDDLTIFAINYRNNSSLRKTLVIENNLNEIDNLHLFIDAICEEFNFPIELTMQLNLALEEIVANVILYAYPNEKNKKIEINAEMSNNELSFVISDSGIPFDPTAKQDPDLDLNIEERPIGGLGVYIVKQLMDEVVYSRIDNMNILKLKKIITKQS